MNFEGKNAVFELLNSNKTIEKVLVEDKTFDAKLREMVKLAKDKHLKVEFVTKSVLDKLSETKLHQGIIAVATDYVYPELETVIEDCKNNNKKILVVLLDGVSDPHNLGSVIRVADCVNATCVVIPKNRSAIVNETVTRVSAGALAHVPVCKVNNISSAIKYLKEQNIWVYAADMDGFSIYKTDLTGDVAIVIGGEGQGVSELARKSSDGIVSLPMFGHVNSLNASVSAGVVLYEVVRQNLVKGK